MKKYLLILALFITNWCYSQTITTEHSWQFGLKLFYNDFASAQKVKSLGLSNVLQNHLWSKPNNLQGGFGLFAIRSLNAKLDATISTDLSWVDYLLPTGVNYGSNHLLANINLGANLRMFNSKRLINPYFSTKLGFTSYKNYQGLHVQPGAGIQFNFWNEALVHTNFEYQIATSASLSNQFIYNVGIAVPFAKRKQKKPQKIEVKQQDTVAVVLKQQPATKEPAQVEVRLTDEATGLPLPNAMIVLNNESGITDTLKTDAKGVAVFSMVAPGNYSVKGMLHDVLASTEAIPESSFNSSKNTIILIRLVHNDPRFTLVGETIEKSSKQPLGNAAIEVTDPMNNSSQTVFSNPNDGKFTAQLMPQSEFKIMAKKAGYFSDIENVSTMGLNRSKVLYVQFQLGVEEATTGKRIVLNQIYFETGNSTLNTQSSADLERIVLFLQNNPDLRLEIQGHTDNKGSASLNKKLSYNRAMAVVQYLQQRRIAPNRLRAIGLGSEKPVADNISVEGRAKNRRVEMKIL